MLPIYLYLPTSRYHIQYLYLRYLPRSVLPIPIVCRLCIPTSLFVLFVLATLPAVSGARHEKYTDASSLLTVRRTLEEGRFAVASDDIETGSTIVVEAPYASVLTVDKFGSNCHHCYTRQDMSYL